MLVLLLGAYTVGALVNAYGTRARFRDRTRKGFRREYSGEAER
jgi:hypothetical protein